MPCIMDWIRLCVSYLMDFFNPGPTNLTPLEIFNTDNARDQLDANAMENTLNQQQLPNANETLPDIAPHNERRRCMYCNYITCTRQPVMNNSGHTLCEQCTNVALDCFYCCAECEQNFAERLTVRVVL